MAAELACTANIEYRSACDAICKECRLLIVNRRRKAPRWWYWTFNERRKASNWSPAGYQHEGDILREAGGRSTAGSFLWTMVVLLFAFNILDSILTARALSMGFTEANPVMAGLFEYSMILGMACKFTIVAIGGYALWKFRHVVLATRGMAVLTGCYGAVVMYHLAFQINL